MSDPARLYEEDWYAWTLDQAARLRALPAHQRSNAVDIEHIAEEIEDLGQELLAQIKGLLRRVIEHLLKLEFEAESQARKHWMREVDAFRADLHDRLSRERAPSLYARREAIYAEVWPSAERLFVRSLERDGARLSAMVVRETVNGSGHFDLDTQVLNPDWYPEPAA